MNNLPKIDSLCGSIPFLVATKYKPNNLAILLSYFGSAETTISYFSASNQLQKDLHLVKSSLSKIKLICENPELAEQISV